MLRNKGVYISKMLSLMLRHRPDEFGIAVDAYGYAPVEDVLRAVQSKDESLTREDLEAVVYDSEKQRFEIVEERIRARYGHSFSIELGIEPSEPPEFLYKGVDVSETDAALTEGLKPFDRDYLHLSFEAYVAARLGGGRHRPGAVIRIEARRAHEAGIPFYDCGPTILTKEIPAEFLALEDADAVSEPPEAEREIPASEATNHESSVSYGRRRRFNSRR